MTIDEVIENVRELKNGYDIKEENVIEDINRIEMNIMLNIVSGREGEKENIAEYGNYGIDTDRGKQLFTPKPYDTIYQLFCCCQIDLAYEDSERYEIDSVLFNNMFSELKRYWYQTHRQIKNYKYHL